MKGGGNLKFIMPIVERFDADLLEEIMIANAGSCKFSCGTYCTPVKG